MRRVHTCWLISQGPCTGVVVLGARVRDSNRSSRALAGPSRLVRGAPGTEEPTTISLLLALHHSLSFIPDLFLFSFLYLRFLSPALSF